MSAPQPAAVPYSHTPPRPRICRLDTAVLTAPGRGGRIETLCSRCGSRFENGPPNATDRPSSKTPRPLRPRLTPREVEVLVAWLQQESKTSTGRDLYISPSTVRTHVQRIRDKYAGVGRPARTKLALAIRAIQDGLISVDDL